MRARSSIALAGAALVVLAGCARSQDPETAVRAWLDAAAAAAEARDVGDLRALIADDYADGRGNDKAALVNYCRALVLRHQTVRVFVDVDEIEMLSPTWAKVGLRAALAGREVDDSWWQTRADLYRFDLELIVADGDWRLIRADWRRDR